MAAGTKRDFDGQSKQADSIVINQTDSSGTDQRTDICRLFEHFRNELDEHHARKERIVKVSRDVTASSKKIIFALHRIQHLQQPFPAQVETTVRTHSSTIRSQLAALEPDVQGINRHRYAWQLRGLEELVEAVTLEHYLAGRGLASEAAAAAAAGVPPSIGLTARDYLLGALDLTGEMMRFATVAAAGPDAATVVNAVLRDMRAIASAIDPLPDAWDQRDLPSKKTAMWASVAKLERLGYGLAIRRGERPSGWLPDLAESAD